MREAGLRTWVDAMGNVHGRADGQDGEDAPLLLVGSHYDTVYDAGKYDGAMGIIVGALFPSWFLFPRLSCLPPSPPAVLSHPQHPPLAQSSPLNLLAGCRAADMAGAFLVITGL